MQAIWVGRLPSYIKVQIQDLQYSNERSLGLVSLKENIPLSRAPPRSLAVEKHKRFKQLESESGHFQSDSCFDGSSENWSICISPKFQTKTVCELETRPSKLCNRCFFIPWNQIQGYTFPLFTLIGQCLAKIKKENATPTWQAQLWYLMLLGMIIQDARKILTFSNLLPTVWQSDYMYYMYKCIITDLLTMFSLGWAKYPCRTDKI